MNRSATALALSTVLPFTASVINDPGAALRQRGQLFVTSMHVDLVMQVNDIRLPARQAGLDRDPGWVADLGKVIRFHFE
jgi:hypothetical protein